MHPPWRPFHGLLLSLVARYYHRPSCLSSRSRFMFMLYGSFILNLWCRSFHTEFYDFAAVNAPGRFMLEIGIKIGSYLHRRYIAQPFIEDVNCKRWRVGELTGHERTDTMDTGRVEQPRSPVRPENRSPLMKRIMARHVALKHFVSERRHSCSARHGKGILNV